MQSTEFYRLTREILAPWCKQQGFKRMSAGRLAWVKPVHGRFLMFWFQVSSGGWDTYAGSRFAVEFQLSLTPTLYLADQDTMRERLPRLFDDVHLQQVKVLQNRVIGKLKKPAAGSPAYRLYADWWDLYVRNFDLATDDELRGDIWFRYRDDEDVRMWAQFILTIMPQALKAFYPALQEADTGIGGAQNG